VTKHSGGAEQWFPYRFIRVRLLQDMRQGVPRLRRWLCGAGRDRSQFCASFRST